MEYALQLCIDKGIPVFYTPGTDQCEVMLHYSSTAMRPLWISIGEQNENQEAALLHELGHINHRLGWGRGHYYLTRELAANAWALNNYQGSDIDSIIAFLRGAIITYVKHDPRALYDAELARVAAVLNIHHMVHWVYRYTERDLYMAINRKGGV